LRHLNIFRAILVESAGHKIAFAFAFSFFILQLGFISYVNAQIDAGALQQDLEKNYPYHHLWHSQNRAQEMVPAPGEGYDSATGVMGRRLHSSEPPVQHLSRPAIA
jgi:hypothetical protein